MVKDAFPDRGLGLHFAFLFSDASRVMAIRIDDLGAEAPSLLDGWMRSGGQLDKPLQHIYYI